MAKLTFKDGTVAPEGATAVVELGGRQFWKQGRWFCDVQVHEVVFPFLDRIAELEAAVAMRDKALEQATENSLSPRLPNPERYGFDEQGLTDDQVMIFLGPQCWGKSKKRELAAWLRDRGGKG